MTAAELVDCLTARGVVLWCEGGELRFRAPAGALTSELRGQVAAQRPAVLAEVAARQVAAAAPRVAGRASFTQERFWFFEQFEPGSAVNNLSLLLDLQGRLDTEALQRSLDEILRRHESLRTTFRAVDGVPVQLVHPPRPWPLARVEAQAAGSAERLCSEDAARAFDLERDLPVRALLARVDDGHHLLGVTLHHIASDGWSLNVFLRELAARYVAQVEGHPAELPPLPMQYAEHAAQVRREVEEGGHASLAYWRERLAGAPASLDLPLDRPRPARQSFSGADCHHRLDAGLAAQVGRCARAHGTTAFTVLLAAFQVLMGRLSGQDDLCIGVPVAGRGRAEAEPLIGAFINTVVVRTRLAPELSFADLLGQVREALLAAHTHGDLPFEAVVNALAPERDLSRTPLFQVLLNMLGMADGRRIDLPGLTMTPRPVDATARVDAKFDLTVYLYPDAQGLSIWAVYNQTLFDAARIEDLLIAYEQLLAALVADPAGPVTAASLVTPAARAALPDPEVALPSVLTGDLLSRLRRHAQGTAASRLAVCDVAQAWTYAELDARSDQLARRLQARGVGREDVVAVLADRTVALPWAMLGIWKAGAAFAILDPAHPPARLCQALALACPRALVRLPGAPDLPGAVADWLQARGVPCLDEVPGAEPPEASFPLAAPPAAGDLAYVAFTSGSTGEPRAVAGEHGPLWHFFDWHARTAGLGEGDRVSVLSGLGHDPLLRDTLGALWAGATVCLPQAAVSMAPGELARWMADQAITVTHLTPAMADLLTLGAEAPGAPRLDALRLACLGGETLGAATVAALRALAPRVRCVNFYGTTETPQAVAWWPLDDGPLAPGSRVPLGRGIDGVQLLVLDPQGRLCGIGELGEIVVRTRWLARGYLNDPAAMAERFESGPGGADDRRYRTGDLGRYRPDGSVEFAGRRDRQLKLRGFRIEPGEVEAALRALPGVREAVVVPWAEGSPEARLVAYVAVDADGGAATVTANGPAALQAALRERLPGPMVPGQVVVLERLPLTPNGKVDLRRLPAPAAPAAAAGHRPPATPAQQAVAAVWAEVLGVNEPGLDDHFFALGGHSLSAARVAVRLQGRVGCTVPVRWLFEAPTLEALAARLDQACAQAGMGPAVEEREEISF